MRASHWIIEDILKAIDEGDVSGLCEKYGKRYHGDIQLREIICELLGEKGTPDIDRIKEKLKELAERRKFSEGAGGSQQLWMADRRSESSERKMR